MMLDVWNIKMFKRYIEKIDSDRVCINKNILLV